VVVNASRDPGRGAGPAAAGERVVAVVLEAVSACNAIDVAFGWGAAVGTREPPGAPVGAMLAHLENHPARAARSAVDVLADAGAAVDKGGRAGSWILRWF
jgi:hypothetical protein